MREKKNFFDFNKSQIRGAIGVLILVVLFNFVCFFVDFGPKQNVEYKEFAWFEKRVDSIKKVKNKMYPFNPNFISEYKGYKLGMSVEELKRLNEYRAEGKFVNSAEEFQKVTGVSDSLLGVISPFFKFPEWVKNRKSFYNNYENKIVKNSKSEKKDINKATIEELKEVYGVGDKLSERIVNYREKIKGFSLKNQMDEVWGLEKDVVANIWEKFDIMELPKIEKMNVNTVDLEELRTLPYLNYKEAREILIYRTRVGNINDLEELLEIKSIDKDKL